MTKTRLRMQIAWPIAFFFGVDEELIRTNHSPPAANFIICFLKFAFTISGVILFWLNGQIKEMWTRLIHWRVHLFWYAAAYLGPAIFYLPLPGSHPRSRCRPLRLHLAMDADFRRSAQSGTFACFLFRSGLGEEFGLRGFELSRLQTRHSPWFLEPFLLASVYHHKVHLWPGRRVLSYPAHGPAL